MLWLLELGKMILDGLKYIVPVFLILFSLFLTVGLLRTYTRATMAVKETFERPSRFIYN